MPWKLPTWKGVLGILTLASGAITAALASGATFPHWADVTLMSVGGALLSVERIADAVDNYVVANTPSSTPPPTPSPVPTSVPQSPSVLPVPAAVPTPLAAAAAALAPGAEQVVNAPVTVQGVLGKLTWTPDSAPTTTPAQ
jgi:hypothetical protein